ncbi:MAG: solute-binding protein [Magnetococcales bacterium]|nr:substrate-binding domain-containing protein [Magnetococcales bacterium]NGZ25443.1 solute-binding protein [Magnetococcales bacterium]
MKNVRALALSFTMAVALPLTTLAKDVVWTGCDVLQQGFMEVVAKAYEAKTGVHVVVSGGGATKGIRAVSAGNAEMGGTCRHVLKDGAGVINGEEKDVDLVPVAWDPLAIIVHKDNPVSNITTENLKKVYDGQITNWKDLGGSDTPVALVTREGKTSGVGFMLRGLLFNDVNYEFKARSIKEKDTTPLEKRIEKTHNAIGASGLSSAQKKDLKMLAIDGVAPNKENILAGKYPLVRPLYLTIVKNPSPEAKGLLDFTLSPEGQAIIAKEGGFNLTEGVAIGPIWEGKKKNLN